MEDNFLLKMPRIWQALLDWIWAVPVAGEPFWQRNGRAACRIVAIVGQEFFRDRISLRASALTFTVVLSMVPMLALGTAVLKGLGGDGQMRQMAYAFIDQQETSAPASPDDTAAETASMNSHLRRAVTQIFDYVDRTNFAALGAFGIAGLLLAVLTVLGSIEEAMNAIWRADRDRPFSRKVVDYLALIILLPVTINLALAAEATLNSPWLLDHLRLWLPFPWLGAVLLKLMPMVVVVAVFGHLYRFLPNTRVRFLPALVGGLVGGLGWFLTQSIYVGLQIGVARYNAIYGSFATLPLFLLWLYVGWVVFLLGAEVAFAVQEWPNCMRKQTRLSPSLGLAIAFTILRLLTEDYQQRRVSNFQSLTERLPQPPGFIRQVLTEMIEAGLVRRVSGNKETGYLPASPSATISPVEIVDLMLGTEVAQLAASDLAQQALTGARTAVLNKAGSGLTPG